MIYISESTRILDNYYFVNENANENTIIDSIFENTNVIDNYRFLNEGSVFNSIIEGIKKIFTMIKEKIQNVWKIITEALMKIKNKIHKKKDSSDNEKNINNMSQEEKEELDKKVKENQELSEILLDLDKINKNMDILNKINGELLSFNSKSAKALDDFNNIEEYIEYFKNIFYNFISKLFDGIDVGDANSMVENVKKYIKDNFRIVDDNNQILDKYKTKKTFKSFDELQKYKDDLIDIIDKYNKKIEYFMNTIDRFIKRGNDFIVSIANECNKNNMDDQSIKKVTSETTKVCNQTINATSDIGKIATENVVVLGKVSEKIDAETEKMMKFKSDVANANTVEELKKLFPNTDWGDINNETFANSLSKEQMIKLIKAVNFTIEEFICLSEGWKRGFANIMTIDRNVISKAYQGTARKAEDKFAKLSYDLQQIIFFVAIRSDNISDYFKEYYDKIIIKNSKTSKEIDDEATDEATIENIKKWFKEGHADYSKLVVYYARLMITKCLDHDLYNGFAGLDPSLYRSLFNSMKYVEHLCSNYTSLYRLSSTNLDNKLFDALPKIYPNIKKDSKNIYLKAKKKYINYINNEYQDEDAKEEIEIIKRKEKKYLGYIVESYSIDNIDNVFSEISFI